MNFTPTREGPRINDEIGVPRVRLVDERGQMVGVVGRNEALALAGDARGSKRSVSNRHFECSP